MSGYNEVLKQVQETDRYVRELLPGFDDNVREIEGRAEAAIAGIRSKNPEPRIEQVIDLTQGSPDFLYPVWWSFDGDQDGVNKITFVRHYSWDHEAHPIHLGAHQSGLLLEIEGNDTAWGGGAKVFEVKRFHETYSHVVSHLSFKMKGYAKRIKADDSTGGGTISGLDANNEIRECTENHSGLYLRGGLTYKVIKNWEGDVNVFGFDVEEQEIFRFSAGNFVGTVKPIPLSDMDQPPKTLNAFVDPV